MTRRFHKWLSMTAIGAIVLTTALAASHGSLSGQPQLPIVNYADITNNKDKLTACYSLQWDMILEHNEQGKLAMSNPAYYMDSGRWYTYTEIFRTKLKLLLAEQNRLKELIWRANYTAWQWAVANQVSPTAQYELYIELFGDESTLKATDTAATTILLTQLDAIDLTKLEPLEFVDPLEDFTTYTEYEESTNWYTVNATAVNATAQANDEASYVYKDMTADHFDGDFEHLQKIACDAADNSAVGITWMIANDIGDMKDLSDNTKDYLGFGWLQTAGGTLCLYLWERSGASTDADFWNAPSTGTWYYPTIERDETAGSIYVYIYDDESRTSLQDTLDNALIDNEDFRYIYATCNWDDGDPADLTFTSRRLDLQETGPPTVTTAAASVVEDTSATLNGEVTLINDTSIDTRGFAWGTSTQSEPSSSTTPCASAYDDCWSESSSFGTGTFNENVTNFTAGTTYYYRAAAENDLSLWGWGSEQSFLTKPAAPTNVAATDGVHTDKVVVTWTKSPGTVTGYKVYRDAVLIDTIGDVATYDDTGADAGKIVAGTSVASDGTSGLNVSLSISGESTANGTTHTYKVRAYNGSGDSDDSATDTGYRTTGSLTYQWQRSNACGDAGYGNIVGATTESYEDTAAPAPTLTTNNATACDGCSSSFVTLSCNETSADGVCRWYHCVMDATGAAQNTSASNAGYRGDSTPTYQWYRSAADSAANFTQIAGGTTDPYNDTGGVTDPDGRYYLVYMTMIGATSGNSSTDRGYMSAVNITDVTVYPDWQYRLVGLNASLYCIVLEGNSTVSGATVTWNTSGVGSILWSENITGADGRADCRVTSNASGNQTMMATVASLNDTALVRWTGEPVLGTTLPVWYFVLIGCAIVGAWYTKDIILYIAAIVACGGMIWWVQHSTLEAGITVSLTAIFIMLAAVMVFGVIRRGEFSFTKGVAE